MKKFKVKALKRDDICSSWSSKTIVSSDFRATSEFLELVFPEMYSYENYAFILSARSKLVTTIVSDSYKSEHAYSYAKQKKVLVAKSDGENRSVYDRLSISGGDTYDELFVCVPHPAADRFAQSLGIQVNESYQDFLRRNNKITQKELLGALSPKWTRVKRIEIANLDVKSHKFLKRSIGSGGHTVFDLTKKNSITKAVALSTKDKKLDWYIEDSIDGAHYSAQFWSWDSNVTLFGWCEQVVKGTVFEGSKIYPLQQIPDTALAFLDDAVSRCSDLLNGYNGFFGIDYVIGNDGSLYILEFNIRMTSASLPALLTNEQGDKVSSVYYENVKSGNPDMRFGFSQHLDKPLSGLTFYRNMESLGASHYIQIADAKLLTSKIDRRTVDRLNRIIVDNVSTVVSSHFYNFEPYGWTVSFILAESHCVMSSWYKEKIICIDVFCCREFNDSSFACELSIFFSGSISCHETKNRLNE